VGDGGGQVVVIAPLAVAFTAVCAACGAVFAGRLDADLAHGVFLCRAGHAVEVRRDSSQSDSTQAA
jgi:hypothetical protein